MKRESRSCTLVSLVCLVLTGCSTGYTKSGDQWTYIVINEAVGRKVLKINADVATFRILEDPEYACDKNHVYKSGTILEGFDGASFEFFGGNQYARDKNHIYFKDSIVVGADRNTFRVLGYPYARDAKNIYCGCLRMNVVRPENFRVLEEGDVGQTSWFYSTKDLVQYLGKEFSDHQVLYKAKGEDDRYRIAIGWSGTATDGVWIYEGPKRSRRAR